jgi:hypothetical protein
VGIGSKMSRTGGVDRREARRRESLRAGVIARVALLLKACLD